MGIEPPQLALVEIESPPVDHLGKLSVSLCLLLQVSSSAGRVLRELLETCPVQRVVRESFFWPAAGWALGLWGSRALGL